MKFREYDILASICRQSFYRFLQEFWHIFIPETPVWNWHIKFICDELQTIAERVFKNLPKEYDLITNVPPGTTKSSIHSIAFPAWIWTRMPSARFLGGSYSYELALDFSRKNRDVVKSELYRKCFPYIKIRVDQDSKGFFINNSGGERYTFGVDGTVTGRHSHFIVTDDPINPKQAASDLEIGTANNFMRETLSSRKVDKAIVPEILVMQRLHQNDPTGDRLFNLAAGPVRHICLPAELGDHVSPPEVKSCYVDNLLDPTRLNRKVLEEEHAKLGDYGYSSQYDQTPVPKGGGMFNTKLITIQSLPSDLRFRSVVRFWDKAGSKRKGAAFTSGGKVGIDIHGRVWIMDIKRGRWNSAEREKLIQTIARNDGKGTEVGTEQEPGSGGMHSAEVTIRSLHGFRVFVDKPTGEKQLRAEPLSCQVNAGNVWMAEGVWNAEFLDEMRFFPYSRYKDQVDSVSGAYNRASARKVKIGAFNLNKPWE